ncbi:MAG: sugar phosphate isomerase/epimerase [Ruminococcaceae bacterium]|nr:sugar phosphate isomerase/epimerase [Oscillospiraceae bacterium]
MDIALQLWSVHKLAQNDFCGTVQAVAEHGWNGVEFAGFGDLTSEEMADLLSQNGLYAVGAHCDMAIFEESLVETLSYLKKVGARYMIIPAAPCDTIEDVQKIVSVLNFAAPIAKQYGIKVGYHNHASEFKKLDEKYILDIIAEQTADDVVIELDVFWVKYAGVDPYEYIQKLGKKVELVHLKQIAKDEKSDALLSDGILDMRDIVQTAKYATHFIVEQEGDFPELESSKKNAEYVREIFNR